MPKRISLRSGALLASVLAFACALPALAASTTSDPVPVRVLAQQTVRAHSFRLGLFLILIGAAVVLWLVLRWRAVSMGYHPGQKPGPGGFRTGGYPGGYMPGAGGVNRDTAGFVPPAETGRLPDPDPKPSADRPQS